ncbi:hypothetical protein BpHYR1_011365 [Brachionus plicatilis]|uniref:Uncharacterized protein n=1 Tax=Brachionus plicatilis TaxID=10195 RepID=A0A3M7PYT5_BRAPC|nr:hypothetical protein BpHYR1_011365 [Brachionus plicatilis]
MNSLLKISLKQLKKASQNNQTNRINQHYHKTLSAYLRKKLCEYRNQNWLNFIEKMDEEKGQLFSELLASTFTPNPDLINSTTEYEKIQHLVLTLFTI